MLHHPTKYHTNALTHFLNLHTTATVATAQSSSPNNTTGAVAAAAANLINSNNLSSAGQNIQQQLHASAFTSNTGNHHQHHQFDYSNATCGTGCISPNSIDGKSFTIAAILGLNNNHNNSRNRNFNEVVNLSLNQSQHNSNNKHFVLGGFDRVPTHYDGAMAVGNGGTPSAKQFNGFNGHQQHTSPASALQNLQQLHQQHINATTAGNFVSREKYKSVLDQTTSKKSSMKSKRVRTIFTPEQLERLEAEFERQQYMVGPERLYLAHTLQLTEAQVKVWFQNRRIKWRKHHLEVTQQRLALIRQRQMAGGTIMETHNDTKDTDMNSEDNNQESPDSPDLTVCSDSIDPSDID